MIYKASGLYILVLSPPTGQGSAVVVVHVAPAPLTAAEEYAGVHIVGEKQQTVIGELHAHIIEEFLLAVGAFQSALGLADVVHGVLECAAVKDLALSYVAGNNQLSAELGELLELLIPLVAALL